jgi:hypothetical protein
MTAATVGDLVLFAGGSTNLDLSTDLVEVYIATTDKWSTARLSQGTVQQVHGLAVGTKAIFTSGERTFDVYDASTGEWSVKALSASAAGAYPVGKVGRNVIFAGGGPNGAGIEIFRDPR